jgi:tRNA pseudouridine38-40 synthase
MNQAVQAKDKQRIALVIQYLGTHFYGWQRQPDRRTVQAEIETALSNVLQHSVTVHAAGRTDTGVHAAAQVAHFEASTPIPPQRWAAILNKWLPEDIVIRASAAVADNWHARFSATWRRYRYTLYTGARPNLFVAPVSWHYYHAPLDVDRIQEALDPLLGTHHLAAFHRANSSRSHSWVDVHEAHCDRDGPLVYIEVQANAFLYGMMRLLVGMLVKVGRGTLSTSEFAEIWRNERRERVKYAAPPQGLCLLGVGYPDFPFPREIWDRTLPKYHFDPPAASPVGSARPETAIASNSPTD